MSLFCYHFVLTQGYKKVPAVEKKGTQGEES